MKNAAIMIEKSAAKGIFLCIVGYFFASMIGVGVKLMTAAVPLTVILFYQNLICLLLLLPSIYKSGIGNLKTVNVSDYVVRIGSGVGCSLALFYAIRFMPISEALVYQYSAPLWIPFIMSIWLKVELNKNVWYGILLGFVGMLLILKPDAPHLQLVSLVGVVCGIFQGISVVSVRKLSLSEPTQRILFYNFLVGTIIALPFVWVDHTYFGQVDYLILLGIGVTTYLAQRFFTLSFQYANATTLAPMCYMAILFSGLFGWLIWHEVIVTKTLIGMVMVIVGCVLSIRANSRSRTEFTQDKSYTGVAYER